MPSISCPREDCPGHVEYSVIGGSPVQHETRTHEYRAAEIELALDYTTCSAGHELTNTEADEAVLSAYEHFTKERTNG